MTATTSISPTARQVWRRLRGLLLAAAVLAVAGVIIAAVRSGEQHGILDPRSPDPYGSRATAELLAERGVETDVVTTSAAAAAAAGPDTTVLVTRPDALSDRQRTALRGLADAGGRTVLVAPGPASTADLAPGVRAAGSTAAVQATPPDCDFPAARRAGDADLGGVRYRTATQEAEVCYLRQGLPTLVRTPAGGGGDTVLLGTPDPLYNDRLDDLGNASLTLQLLGSRPHLVWYLPSLSDAAASRDDDRGIIELVPDGWTWAVLQLAVAALLAAFWRARRLGPLVRERMPVRVLASETTEGRARLYRTANARDRAAQALRTSCRARLAPLVGVPTAQAHSPEALTPVLAAYADRRDDGAEGRHGDADLHALLFGPAPVDDAALIRLADELDALERRLGPSTSPSPLPTAPPTDKDRTS